MNILKSARILSLMVVAPLLGGTTAWASSLSFTLIAPLQSALPGNTVSFEATVANTGLTPLFLNGDSASLGGPLLLDDSLFLTGFPLSLNPGDSFTGELFNVSVLPGAPGGLYAGSFAILGGNDTTAQDILEFVTFNVDVAAGSAIPEPSSLFLCLSGLALVVGGVRRSRSQS